MKPVGCLRPARAGGEHERAGPSVRARPVVDGKFLARAGRRLRVRGVTYGPFAANADGEPFPAHDQVRDDFQRMAAIGLNSIRTYHAPPEWLLPKGASLSESSLMGRMLELIGYLVSRRSRP